MPEKPKQSSPLIFALDPFPGLLAPVYEALEKIGEVRIITELNRALPQTVQAGPDVVVLPYRTTAPGAFRFDGPLFERMALGLLPSLEGRFVFYLTEEDPEAKAPRLFLYIAGTEAKGVKSAVKEVRAVLSEKGLRELGDSA